MKTEKWGKINSTQSRSFTVHTIKNIQLLVFAIIMCILYAMS